jgi:hypothetical protein
LHHVLVSDKWSNARNPTGSVVSRAIPLTELLYEVCESGHQIAAAFHAVVDLIDLGAVDPVVPPVKKPLETNLDEGEGCALLDTTPKRINQYFESKSPKERPVWNSGAKTLIYRGVLCKQLGRSGSKQIAILDAFEASGWADSIKVPCNMSMQTIHDMNKTMTVGSLLVFGFSEKANAINWRAKRS